MISVAADYTALELALKKQVSIARGETQPSTGGTY